MSSNLQDLKIFTEKAMRDNGFCNNPWIPDFHDFKRVPVFWPSVTEINLYQDPWPRTRTIHKLLLPYNHPD